MEQNLLWKKIINLLKMEVIPATGCTEPISLAFAAAQAVKVLGEPVERIEGYVSANMMKNGMGVIVPGTATAGLPIAAAVGALGGDPTGGLQVLKSLSPQIVAAGQKMVNEKKVTVAVTEVPYVLYSEARVYGSSHWARVCIANAHTNIIRIEKDGQLLLENPPLHDSKNAEKKAFLHQLTAQQVYDFATQVPVESISFMKEAALLNDALAEAGFSGQYGLHLGSTMRKNKIKGLIGDDLQNQIIMTTVAASDARMGGAPLPAMTNSGSGNQGIMATEPVSVVARYVQADEETLIRALTLSHLMAVYIHGYLPKLSALCAVSTAAMGAAAGMAWLFDHKFTVVTYALSTMTGDLIGMVCDGAANSCSMKVATACGSAFRAVLLALDGVRVTGSEGLVSNKLDESIHNIGNLARNGMIEIDKEILQIMLHKNQQ